MNKNSACLCLNSSPQVYKIKIAYNLYSISLANPSKYVNFQIIHVNSLSCPLGPHAQYEIEKKECIIMRF